MILELSKTDLINLLNGVSPSYNLLESPLIKQYGSYDDNRGWSWDEDDLDSLNEQDLYTMYVLCKASWII